VRFILDNRVCGYHRPITSWNLGKRAEFKDRKTFDAKVTIELTTQKLVLPVSSELPHVA
jgi:hypothetical protein